MISFSNKTSFFFQAEDGIRDYKVTGVQTCALPIFPCEPAKTAIVGSNSCTDFCTLSASLKATYGGLQTTKSKSLRTVRSTGAPRPRLNSSLGKLGVGGSDTGSRT